MRVIPYEDSAALLTMADCLRVLEQAYRELNAGRAKNVPRQSLITPGDDERVHGLKTESASLSCERVIAVRINSDILHWPLVDGDYRRVKLPAAPGDNYVGLVLLLSADTGELLALMPDGFIQAMRVAATGGLSIARLARQNASTMGLIGAGWQARAAARAGCEVRPLKKIRVFSPNPKSRTKFAEEMRMELNVEIEPVATARDAAKGADIVSCATNALGTVFEAGWAQPGQHILCIRKNEIDPALFPRAERVVIHDKQLKPQNYVIGDPEKYAELREGYGELDLSAYPELDELITGDIPGRQTDRDITVFCNNRGTGLQFAAVGKHVLDLAIRHNRGHDLPKGWFVQPVQS